MVKNKQLFVSTLLALLILTGCMQLSLENKNIIAPNEKSVKNHQAAEIPLEAYKKVLLNKFKFFSTEDKKSISLNNFLDLHFPDYRFKVTRFALLDLDGDKIPEVVLELTHNDYPDEYEVLHYMNGIVYGYNIEYRGLEELKKDGTFTYSNGAADNGFGKLRFDSNTYKTDILGYSESSENNGVISIAYFINQKRVSEEAFNSFWKEQNQKEAPSWYKFSQNNIEKELTLNK